jgi:8-oxo-dGTP pyrophosphatase MutT (NUDIX family)
MKRNFWVNLYHKSATRCVRTSQWLLGASTVGVRTLVMNDREQVLLVKHTYMEGWHFPGGGVLPGEPARVAAIRELREETGVISAAKIELFGVYFHRVMRVNDYIILYIVNTFTHEPIPLGGEIGAIEWFSIHNLPDDITDGTRARINEYFFQQPIHDQW